MAGSLPTVRSGAAALYPLTQRLEYITVVNQFVNGTEQTWKKRAPQIRLLLQYIDLSVTDRNAIVAFFISQRGGFDKTWSVTLPAPISLTYSNLCFEDDSIRFEERKSTLFSTTLRIRQTQNRNYATPVVAAVYPALASGAYSQLPYVRIEKFVNSKNNAVCGQQFAWAWYGSGLTGFPAVPLFSWELNYPVLIDADVATLETFFKSCNGRWKIFSFTDPEGGAVHPKCRFAMDVFEARRVGPNQTSAIITIEETN